MDTGNLSQKDVIVLEKCSTGLKFDLSDRLFHRITIDFSNVKLISEVSFSASNVEKVIICAEGPNHVMQNFTVPFKDDKDLLSNDVMCLRLDIEFVPVDVFKDTCIHSVKVGVCEKGARGWPFRSIKSLPSDIKENAMITDLRSVQSKLIGRRFRQFGKMEEGDSEVLKQLNLPIMASMRLKHFLLLKGTYFDKLKSDSSLVKVCYTLESAFFEYLDECNPDDKTFLDFIRNCALMSKVIRLSCCRYDGDFEYQWWTYRFVTPRCVGIIVDHSKMKGFHIWSIWNFVSGKMRDDEDKQASALREIREEVGELGVIQLGDCLVDKESVPNVHLFYIMGTDISKEFNPQCKGEVKISINCMASGRMNRLFHEFNLSSDFSLVQRYIQKIGSRLHPNGIQDEDDIPPFKRIMTFNESCEPVSDEWFNDW